MSARLISIEGSQVKIELTIELSKSMIESEGKIQGMRPQYNTIIRRQQETHID